MSSIATTAETETKSGSSLRLAATLIREKSRQGLLAVSALWLIACSLSIWFCTWDDSYILFRYARNLVNGWGLVFNAGQRVEGYTGFLWVFLLAAGTRVTSDPILISKILGIIFQLSVLAGGYFLCRQVATEKTPMYGFALILTASNTHFIAGTVSGLETPLFTSLLCWSLVAYLHAIQETIPRRREGWCAAACTSACWTIKAGRCRGLARAKWKRSGGIRPRIRCEPRVSSQR